MDIDKPWNDVADQLRPATPEPGAEPEQPEPMAAEADPADVTDQRREVPLPPDEPWP